MTVTAAPVQTRPVADVPPLTHRLTRPWPADGWRGWAGPAAMTVVAGVLRFWHLGTPHAVVFDETYYVKDGLALVRYGYEHNAVDKADQILLSSHANWAHVPIFQNSAEYVVHPPVGKWVIGLSQVMFGPTPNGWRMLIALMGTLAVLMVGRIMRRLARSNLIGTLAAFLMAIDGMAIVLSRTALLDGVLMFFTLCGFGAILLDRDFARVRLAKLVAAQGVHTVSAGFGPTLWWRPWRWIAGISLGLACGVKWSGIYYLAAFSLLSVIWDYGARRSLGVRHPLVATVFLDGILAAGSIAVVAVVVYIASWSGWLLTSGGYYRNWATSHSSYSFIPTAFRSLWHYHAEAWAFHTHLHTPHSYMSNPWGWQLQARPTSFYFDSPKLGHSGCTAATCAAEVVALGNPLIWWTGLVALLHQVWRWFAHRDWRSGALLAAYIAGWAPWLLWQERTIFTFYSVVFTPFMLMALALTLGTIAEGALARGGEQVIWAQGVRGRAIGAVSLLVVAIAALFVPIWLGTVAAHYGGFALIFVPVLIAISYFTIRAVMVPAEHDERQRVYVALGLGLLLLSFVAVSAYFYPLWVGQVLPYAQWHARMWFPSWV